MSQNGKRGKKEDLQNNPYKPKLMTGITRNSKTLKVKNLERKYRLIKQIYKQKQVISREIDTN